MAANAQTVVERYECAHCGGDRDPSASVAGSYCSMACHRAARREARTREVFRLLIDDHRFCATCFAQLKEVAQPASRWGVNDAVTGYQTRTSAATTGEVTRRSAIDDSSDGPPPVDRARTGTVCRCGTTDHSTPEPSIRQALSAGDPEDYWRDRVVGQLLEAAAALRSEGKHDVRVDGVAVLEARDRGASVRQAFADGVVLE